MRATMLGLLRLHASCDVKSCDLRKECNSLARFLIKGMAKAKSEYIGKIGEKFVRLPTGISAF